MILDPLDAGLMALLRAAEVVLECDQYCAGTCARSARAVWRKVEGVVGAAVTQSVPVH